MNTPSPPAEAAPQPAPARLVWRWFRLVGLPLVAITAITGAVILLRTPDEAGTAVRLDTATLDHGSEAAGAAVPGAIAPDFTLQTSDGRTYHLQELRGHYVVLNFWATWCGPCKAEMPAFEEEAHGRAGSGLVVLAINVREAARQVDPYVQKLGLTFPILLDESGAVSSRYRVRELPTTVFIRPDGVIDGIRRGSYTRRLLTTRLDQFLEE